MDEWTCCCLLSQPMAQSSSVFRSCPALMSWRRLVFLAHVWASNWPELKDQCGCLWAVDSTMQGHRPYATIMDELCVKLIALTRLHNSQKYNHLSENIVLNTHTHTQPTKLMSKVLVWQHKWSLSEPPECKKKKVVSLKLKRNCCQICVNFAF